jgi:hypothetical protein
MATAVVFRLLKRAESESGGPAFEVGWTGRLHALGLALDEYDSPLRDLAIMTMGYDTWVTALGYQGGMYHSVWAPVTLRVEDHAAEYVAPPPSRDRTNRPLGWSVVKPTEPWAQRLRALGVLLDRSPSPLRDVVLLDIDGGFVAQGLILAQSADGEVWVSTTGEVTAKEISATARELPPASKVRVMRLRKLELA